MREFLASRVILVFTLTGKNASQKKRTKYRGGSRDFERGGALCRPPWLATEKAKITLETISFWQYIYISILSFSPFLYTMKARQ